MVSDIHNLSNEMLRGIYEEIIEWDKTGVLQDGVLRKMIDNEANRQPLQSYTITMINERNFILNEIAKRWYKSK